MSYRIEQGTGDIIIDNWQRGISTDPYSGFADMRNVNIAGSPNEVSVNFKTVATQMTAGVTGTLTLTTTNNSIANAQLGIIGMAFTVSSSAGGLSTGTVYYVISNGAGGYSAALSHGGNAVTITSNTTTTFTSIDMGLPVSRTTEITVVSGIPSATYYILDANGRAWVTNNSTLGNSSYWTYMNNTTLTSASGQGIVAWKGYLFVFRNSVIDVVPTYGSGTATLTNAGDTVTFSNSGGATPVIGSAVTFSSSVGGVTAGVVYYVIAGNQISRTPGGSAVVITADTNSGYNIAAPASASWTYGWQTLNSNNSSYTQSHYAIVGQDDFVYYCDSNVIGSFNQQAGQTFSPSSTSTYTYNSAALYLPSNEVSTCLGELGTTMLVGGIRNWIYPWDRTAVTPPAVGYKYPIMIPEFITNRIVTANNVAYLFSGNRGKIYATNGSNVQEIGKVPDHLTNTINPIFFWKDAFWNRGKIFFSFSVAKNVGGTAISTMGGVWSMDTDSKAIIQENELSYATYAGFASVLIPQYMPLSTGTSTSIIGGNGFYAGWWDGVTSYGVDNFTNANAGGALPYSNYEAYVDTEKIPVGTFLGPRTFTNLEFKLGEPLTANEKIEIFYRVGLNNAESPVDATAGYTQISETTYSANTISAVYPVTFEKSQWIQFRVRMSSSSSGSSQSFVRLKEIRLRSA